MTIMLALNIVLGSQILLALMFIDYIRKYNTDTCQRKIFLALLIFTFAAMCADFGFFSLEGIPGKTVRAALHICLFAYYFFQVLAWYYVCIFVDYVAFNSRQRTAVLTAGVWIITAVHILILFLNFKWPVYYYLSEDNVFFHGSIYLVRLAVALLPIFIASFDIFSLHKSFKTKSMALLVFFVILTGAGSASDVFLNTNSLVWPCFAAALLYAYFFIVQSESRIDGLTGLGNRYSFNDFIDKLANSRGGEFRLPFIPRRRTGDPGMFKRKKPAEAYSFMMIDMDHFKAINDTLGHLEGDNALRDMAAIIKSSIRQSDFAARYGGDEFILAVRRENDITALISRIQAAIDKQNEKNERPYKLEISYGHDVYTVNSGVSVTDFLKHIDSLMYKHKNERRRASDMEKKINAAV